MSKSKAKPRGLAPAPQKGISKEIAADRRRAQAADRRQREKKQEIERAAARQRLSQHKASKPSEEQLRSVTGRAQAKPRPKQANIEELGTKHEQLCRLLEEIHAFVAEAERLDVDEVKLLEEKIKVMTVNYDESQT